MPNIRRKNNIARLLIILAIILVAYSLTPIIAFYLTPEPKTFEKNEDVIKKFEKNEDPYFPFIVLSDTASGLFFYEAETQKIITNINKEDRFNKIPIDFVVNVGDVTFRGKERHYKNYIKLKNTVKFPVISAIGNHDEDIDNGPKGLALFKKYCGEKEFSFVDRNSYFIIIDDQKSEFTNEQFKWLENELEKAQKYSHRFIFMHKPPFNPYQQSWYRIELLPWSYEFMKLCEKYKVDIVFSGHEYVQKTEEFGGVKYVSCCGGGTLLLEAPSWEGSFMNYVVVKVNRDYVSYEVRRIQSPLWLFLTFDIWKDVAFFIGRLIFIQ